MEGILQYPHCQFPQPTPQKGSKRNLRTEQKGSTIQGARLAGIQICTKTTRFLRKLMLRLSKVEVNNFVEKINKRFYKMGASALPILFFTILWGAIGVVLPFFVPKGPNRGVVQVCLILTGACCWLFWLCCYMCQMNPLIGPIIKKNVALVMQQEWGNGPNAASA